MNRTPFTKQAALRIILLVIGIGILLAVRLPLPANMGAIDFRPYWSSSFLLAHGQDFSDPSTMNGVERTLTGWSEPFTMYAWFAPTGNLVLLPYTFFPFTRATYYWLLTNITIVFFSALLIWGNTTLRTWIPLVAAFGFSTTLVSFISGQVNTLVVLGLALLLFFCELRRDFAAGASLALATTKAHLVILTLPLLLLDIMRRKQWRAFAGFVTVLSGCALILFVLYPAWPISFWRLVNLGMMGTAREAPTVSGLFVVAGERIWGKWIWVPGLFFAILVWWKRGKGWDLRTLIDVSILGGMLISPIGWSYDQVMLLFPILHVLKWAADGSLARRDAIAVALLLIVVDAITFYQCILTPSEVWFFWVPLVVAAVYVFARQRSQARLLDVATKAV